MMDENVLSYLGQQKPQEIDAYWSEIVELESLRNIRQVRSSTRMIRVRWGDAAILVTGERHYESL